MSTLYSITETLNIMNENNYFKKKFPKLDNFTDLNKIDYIIIAYTNCITLYKNFSYNYLAINTGKKILDYIYYNKYLKKRKKEQKGLELSLGLGKQSIENLSKEEFKKLVDITDSTQTFKLGDFYMSFLQQFPHELFIRKLKSNSYFTNEPYFLELNHDYIEVIRNNIIINPNTLPMICVPNT